MILRTVLLYLPELLQLVHHVGVGLGVIGEEDRPEVWALW